MLWSGRTESSRSVLLELPTFANATANDPTRLPTALQLLRKQILQQLRKRLHQRLQLNVIPSPLLSSSCIWPFASPAFALLRRNLVEILDIHHANQPTDFGITMAIIRESSSAAVRKVISDSCLGSVTVRSKALSVGYLTRIASSQRSPSGPINEYRH